MAKLSPKKINLNEINGGNEYLISDGIQPSTINGVIGASAYAQALATNTPDTSNANLVGTPSVSIVEQEDGTPKFSFAFLKGQKGDSGIGDAKLSNEVGESDTDGYTQKTVNSIISNPNFLINGNFSINQRGQTSYSGYVYSVDRWIGNSGTTITPLSNGIRLSRDTLGNALLQRVENWKDLVGKTVTLSAKITSNTGKVRISIFTNQTSATEFFEGTGIIKLTRTIPQNADRLETFIGLDSNTTIEIEYMKLEIGSVATAFSPRPYAQELAMCQRYYQIIKPLTSGIVYVDSNGRALLVVPKTVETRNSGTATITGGMTINSIQDIVFARLLSSSSQELLYANMGFSQGMYDYTGNIVLTIDAEIY